MTLIPTRTDPAPGSGGGPVAVGRIVEVRGLLVEGAPLIDERFWSDWAERSVGELVVYVSKNMPFSEDGSLAGRLQGNPLPPSEAAELIQLPFEPLTRDDEFADEQARATPHVRKPDAHAGAMIGLKAATTVSTIVLAERLWKKNRAAAVVMLPLAARSLRNTAPFILLATPAASRLLGADFRLPAAITRLVRRSVTMVGSFGARMRSDVPELIDLVARGAVDTQHLVTQRFTLETAGEAYAALDRGEITGRAMVVVDPEAG